MDALAGLLDGPRAQGAFLLRAILDPPWAIRVQDEAPLAVVAIMRGDASVWPDHGDAMRLRPGDVLVTHGPEAYTMADDPATPIQAIIHPRDRCETLDGRPLYDEMSLGVRTWGTSLDGSFAMLVGTYHTRGEISQRLLSALPPLLVLRRDEWSSASLVPLLAEEVVRDEPGQEVMLDRLLDLVVIAVLRAWFARPEAGAPGWYRAHGDPVVGTALQLLHNNPAYPWTVENLAKKTGVSRAGLARRFTELVGEPPMAYLTGWRLAMAADLLREPDTTVAAAARQVGYSSAFALSTAFKRVRGITPQQHRTRATAAPVGARSDGQGAE